MYKICFEGADGIVCDGQIQSFMGKSTRCIQNFLQLKITSNVLMQPVAKAAVFWLFFFSFIPENSLNYS